jgi:hypothetical protein
MTYFIFGVKLVFINDFLQIYSICGLFDKKSSLNVNSLLTSFVFFP